MFRRKYNGIMYVGRFYILFNILKEKDVSSKTFKIIGHMEKK